MAISEAKMKIVIDNYFDVECDVNTSIRQAFEKGFRIGVKKGVNPARKKGKWMHYEGQWICEVCHAELDESSPFCPMCGADMRGENHEND